MEIWEARREFFCGLIFCFLIFSIIIRGSLNITKHFNTSLDRDLKKVSVVESNAPMVVPQETTPTTMPTTTAPLPTNSTRHAQRLTI